MSPLARVGLLSALFALPACGSAQPTGPTQRAAAATNGSLESRSGVACQQDSECEVCYRANTCGESIGAGDPAVSTPDCHVTPQPFCMPRRAHCDNGHCVAR